MAPSCRDRFNLAFSAFGSLVGYSAFFVFFCYYGNTQAGMWGFASGVLATIAFYLHFMYVKERLYIWYSSNVVEDIQILGVIGLLCGFASALFYTFLQFYWKTPVMPVENSLVICIVWSLLTAKWGFLLFKAAERYSQPSMFLIINEELEQPPSA